MIDLTEELDTSPIDFWSYCYEKEMKDTNDATKTTKHPNPFCNYCHAKLGCQWKGNGRKVERIRQHFRVDKAGSLISFGRNQLVCTNNPFEKDTHKKKKQKLMTDHATPKVEPAVQCDFETKLARYFFVVGMTFNKANHPLFQQGLEPAT
jgi:hypothetical protein